MSLSVYEVSKARASSDPRNPKVQRRPVTSPATEGPIFVVGCSNSGTTILQQAILEHPRCAGPEGEGQDLVELPGRLRHFLGPRTSRMFAHPFFGGAYRLKEHDYSRREAARIVDIFREHCGQGKRLVEKSPANSMRTRFLQALYPDATFVVIVRNPYAVAEGIVRKRFFDPDRQHLAGLKTNIGDAALQWYSANMTLAADTKFLRRSITIRYEELVNDTESCLSRVWNSCGLEAPSTGTPTFMTNLNESQISRLSWQELSLIDGCAGPLARALGYGVPAYRCEAT